MTRALNAAAASTLLPCSSPAITSACEFANDFFFVATQLVGVDGYFYVRWARTQRAAIRNLPLLWLPAAWRLICSITDASIMRDATSTEYFIQLLKFSKIVLLHYLFYLAKPYYFCHHYKHPAILQAGNLGINDNILAFLQWV